MNMQQILAQAQKAQRELNKKIAEIEAKEYKVTKGGAVTVTMLGSFEVTSVSIDKDAFDAENKDMVEDMIKMAINELVGQILVEKDRAQEEITGRKGMGF